MLCDATDLLGDVARVHDEIGAARSDRAARHRVVFGGTILGEGNATFGFNGFQSEGAVGGSAGEDDADGAFALVQRKRFEKGVNGAGRLAVGRAGPDFQNAPGDAQVSVMRDNINVVGFDPEIVRRLADGHGGGPRQDLGKRAIVVGVEMLHEDEAETGVGLEVLQQLGEGFKASGGSAHADDGEWPTGMCFRCYRIAGFSSRGTIALLFGLPNS